MVMGKTWNLKKWQKVMEFCDQSCNFTNFATKFYQIVALFAKIYIGLEDPLFSDDILQHLSRGTILKNPEKSWKSHGKSFCKV